MAVCAAVTLVAALLVSGSPASAAPDVTGPTVLVDRTPAFMVGGQVTQLDFAFTPTDVSDDYDRLGARLRWSATDPSGICGYDLQESFAGTEPLALFTDEPTTSWSEAIDDYDGTFGGGSLEPDGWLLTAHDCAGNTTEVTIDKFLGVVNENGTSVAFGPTGTWAVAGGWSTSHCLCALGGEQRHASAAGASATFTRTYKHGDHVALVMAQGPARGSARVYVDGTLRATVNTFRATNVNRVVVWQSWMRGGTHTVRVVVVGTAGHPRIDIDAVALDTTFPS